MSLILGIDPGSRVTGYGLVKEGERGRLTYVASGCIRLKGSRLSDRLQEIFDGVSLLMREFQPDEMAIESVFMHKNANAALKLGQARGAAIVATSIHGVRVDEYSARQVKQAVVGHGGAEKDQVQHMIKSLLALNKTPQSDAADALAIAVCHAHMRRGLKGLSEAKSMRRGRVR